MIKNKKYTLLTDKNLVSIYDLEKEMMIKNFYHKNNLENVVNEIEVNYLREYSSTDNIVKFFNGLVSDFFIEANIEEKNYIKDIGEFTEKIIEVNHSFYFLHKKAINTYLKSFLFNSKVINVYKEQPLEFGKVPYHIINTSDYGIENIESYIDQKTIFLIELDRNKAEEIYEIESFMNEQKRTRIYYFADVNKIVIGPGLIGREYGCLFCEEHYFKSSDSNIDKSSSRLIADLLYYELPKFDDNLLLFLNEDITLTKGKIFTLNKSNFEATDQYQNRNISCEICLDNKEVEIV
ncbi:hypothetical protein ACIQGW_13710 [Lysinibacillus xylanilyticus]|uniref:hypothetical protein n=1 Tax=Lysinibacillus xylanilyticus TaxID=582475 RepID=UPI0038268CDD